MKVFKETLCVCIILLLTNVCFAQVDPVGAFNRHIAERWKGEYIRIGNYKVKGSPYLLGESFPGTISYQDGQTVSDKKILYDIYNQKAGIDVNNKIFERDVPIKSFEISLPEEMGGNKLLFKHSSVFTNPPVNYYFNFLYDGKKIAFLKVYKSKLIPDPFNTMDKELRVFQQYFEYYFYMKKNNALINIKLRKKDIIKALEDDQFMNNYGARRVVDFTKESEIVELIDIYNKS